MEPVFRDCVSSSPGPSAFIASKDISEVASPELKCEQTVCEVTSDKVLPAVVCKELKTIDAGQRLTMKLTDNNTNLDHRNPSGNITQPEICFPLNIKQDVSELFNSSTVTSNQVIMAERGESNLTVSELLLSPPVMSVFSGSVNSSLDEVSCWDNSVATQSQSEKSSLFIKDSSAALSAPISPYNLNNTYKLQSTSSVVPSKCTTYHYHAVKLSLTRYIPEYLMFVLEPHHKGLSHVFVCQVVILVFHVAGPAPLNFKELSLIEFNQPMLNSSVSEETGPFAFRPIKTDSDSENVKTAGSGSVIITGRP